jgi:hypothetical protein
MLTRQTRGAHTEAWKAGREEACRNAGMNVNVSTGVKEREVKESVRIELVKALRQARFILTGRDIAISQHIHHAGFQFHAFPKASRKSTSFDTKVVPGPLRIKQCTVRPSSNVSKGFVYCICSIFNFTTHSVRHTAALTTQPSTTTLLSSKVMVHGRALQFLYCL